MGGDRRVRVWESKGIVRDGERRESGNRRVKDRRKERERACSGGLENK